jgi:hypothetical protein
VSLWELEQELDWELNRSSNKELDWELNRSWNRSWNRIWWNGSWNGSSNRGWIGIVLVSGRHRLCVDSRIARCEEGVEEANYYSLAS